MTPNEYQQLAQRTECDHDKAFERLALHHRGGGGYSKQTSMRLLHSVIGMMGELGELAGALEKWIWYGQNFDEVNFNEEIGDTNWYQAEALNALGAKFEEVLQKNITKLKTRYPDKYSDDKALNRDLESERKALEGKVEVREDLEALNEGLVNYTFLCNNRRGGYFTVAANSSTEAKKKVLTQYPPGDGVLPSEYESYYTLVSSSPNVKSEPKKRAVPCGSPADEAFSFLFGTNQPKAAQPKVEPPGSLTVSHFSIPRVPAPPLDIAHNKVRAAQAQPSKGVGWGESVKAEGQKHGINIECPQVGRIVFSPVNGAGFAEPSEEDESPTHYPGWTFGQPTEAGDYEWFHASTPEEYILYQNYSGNVNQWGRDVYFRKLN